MKNNLKGKKVLILGLGQYPQGSGISSAIYALGQGARLMVTDQKTEQELGDNVRRLKEYANVKFRLGGHDPEDIRWADVIIQNPRVRPNSPEMMLADKLGKTIESDVTLFLRDCPAKVIAITGTRGKSTTATLTADILKRSGKTVWLGGNILVSPLNFIDKVKPDHVVVLEISSWQSESVGRAGLAPDVACVTNLMRDHLNTYRGMEDYASAKAQLFEHQSPEDVLILNGDDVCCRDWIAGAAGRVRLFTLNQEYASSAWVSGDMLLIKDRKERELAKIAELHVRGDHMYMNMLAAALCAREAGARLSKTHQALISFRGLPYRQEIVRVKKGVTYVNDSTATTPDGTIAALKSFGPVSNTMRMILGGSDKELDFLELAKELKRLKADVVVLPGTAHDKLASSLKTVGVRYQDVENLKEAFDRLNKRVKRGDALVLSPGCASFGLFKNEFDRGDQFRALAENA